MHLAQLIRLCERRSSLGHSVARARQPVIYNAVDCSGVLCRRLVLSSCRKRNAKKQFQLDNPFCIPLLLGFGEAVRR
jgi:hypothetical protein